MRLNKSHPRTRISVDQALVIALFVFFILSGCSAQKPTVTTEPKPSSEPPSASNASTFHGWDLITMNGQPVGYQELTLSTTDSGEGIRYEGILHSELRLRRFGDAVVERIDLACREDDRGQLLRVEARSSGEGQIVGRRVGHQLHFQATQPNQAARQWTLDLPAECGGYFAMEWSLRKAPMIPGEVRNMHVLMPVLNQVVQLELQAVDAWNQDELLVVRQQAVLPDGTEIPGRISMNREGEIVRAELPTLNQISTRTTEQIAKSAMENANFDIAVSTTVPIDQDFPAPHASRRAEYRIHLDDASPSELFPETAGQTVTRTAENHTALVTVRSFASGSEKGLNAPPSSADEIEAALQASLLVQSDAPEVIELADQIPDGTVGEMARASEALVHQLIDTKNFSTSFASAVDVARQRAGDCTEHAVLTAAVCRAKQIPCRVLMGLVYVPSLRAFGFHMWNEYYDGEAWIPIDATLGRGRTGAAHLILSRSPLATESGLAACLPVLRVMGQLKIELVSFDGNEANGI